MQPITQLTKKQTKPCQIFTTAAADKVTQSIFLKYRDLKEQNQKPQWSPKYPKVKQP